MPGEYTIWIQAPDKIHMALQNTVKRLAREYDGPVFIPHLTLLGDIDASQEEVTKGAQYIAGRIRPFKLRFREYSHGDTFFQDVFLRADENDTLSEAHRLAREYFKQGSPGFMPHISLLYGMHSPEVKQKIVKDLGDIDLEFEVDRLCVVNSSKTVKIEGWKVLQKIPIKH